MKKNHPKVIIIGQPNVGKSTLFNRLIGKNQSIIAKTAGTTRDLVRAQVSWEGKNFELIDSAGLDNSPDPLTRAAVGLIDKAIDEADVIVFAVDGTVPPSESDHSLARRIRKSTKPAILAINKSDQSKNSKIIKYLTGSE